jgi:hypothetical protein
MKLYLIVGLIWCIFAAAQQTLRHDKMYKLVLCIVSNFVGWPIAMFIVFSPKISWWIMFG